MKTTSTDTDRQNWDASHWGSPDVEYRWFDGESIPSAPARFGTTCNQGGTYEPEEAWSIE